MTVNSCARYVCTHTHNRGGSVPWGGSSSSSFFLFVCRITFKVVGFFPSFSSSSSSSSLSFHHHRRHHHSHQHKRHSPSTSQISSKANLLFFCFSVRFTTAVGQMAKLQIDTGDSSHSIKMRREEEKSLICCDNLSFRLVKRKFSSF